MQPNAYTFETSDIVIPLTELLGECYLITDPHPLAQFEAVADLALKAFTGGSKDIPILDVLNKLTIYQGRENFNEIASLFVRLWGRVFYYISFIKEDLTNTSTNIISISAGDIRIVFETFEPGD